MATKLFLRDTTDNEITNSGDAIVYDMIVTNGSSATSRTVNTAASGTEIQWTDTGGGSSIAWISGRVPAGGFTLTTTDIQVRCSESNMNANCGARYRLYRYQTGGTVTELGGGPFDDGVEFSTAAGDFTWVGNNTDTAFSENDRILLRVFITNVGTMAGGFTCTLTFNNTSGSAGDSFLNLNETVAFKDEIPRVTSWSPRINIPQMRLKGAFQYIASTAPVLVPQNPASSTENFFLMF